MIEEWREHPSGLLVSSLGLIFAPKNRKYPNGRYTYGCKNSWGYLLIGYNRKTYSVHRLVAECFIPNPDNYPCINHKNEDKTDNSVENLEWCTNSYNVNYGTRNERVKQKTTNGKYSKPVLQYDLNGNFIREWPSAHEIERQLGFNYANIVHACIHNHKSHKYIWRYK